MDSTKNQLESTMEEEKELLFALELVGASTITMVMWAAAELDLFEIIAKAGPGAQLSASEIAAHIPTQNPEASDMLDRILSFLASYTVLTCSVVSHEDGLVKKVYGLAPVSKYFVKDENGGSFVPLLTLVKTFKDVWYHLKDAILEGVIPFHKVHGMSLFQYLGKEPKQNQPFHSHSFNQTDMIMTMVLKTYKGFEDLKEVVDLGGGIGTTIRMITSMYPNIRGINFDLPHVIARAPPIPRVRHVGGDIFGSIPKADAIVMKNILHMWKDEQCSVILKSCYEALPDNGKVIAIEIIRPTIPNSDAASKAAYRLDVTMMLHGGMERTEVEFETLAKSAGFAGIRLACYAYSWVIEFCKNL